jgi:hypothetical protein
VISGVVWSGWADQVALDLTGRLPSGNRSLGYPAWPTSHAIRFYRFGTTR